MSGEQIIRAFALWIILVGLALNYWIIRTYIALALRMKYYGIVHKPIYRKNIAQTGTMEKWIPKGNAHLNFGRYNDAVNCYEKAIEMNPYLVDAWKKKGLALRYLGMYKESVECYDKAIRICPLDDNAWLSRGVAKRALQRNGHQTANNSG
jgi:tetratricopeptide (TPR) repeat protein